MTEQTLQGKNPLLAQVDALVVGVAAPAEKGGTPSLVGAELPLDWATPLLGNAAALGITGGAEEAKRVPAPAEVKAPVVILVGLGKAASGSEPFAAETLRRAAGVAVREAAGLGAVALALPATSDKDVAAIAEGALLAAYQFASFRSDAEAAAKGAPVGTVEIYSDFSRSQNAIKAVERAEILAAAVHGARDLTNTPPNVLFPASFAEEAKKATAGLKSVKVTVLDEKALLAGGYGGIMGVGQGSSRPPRLVKVAYTAAKDAPKVALVGKGITFDTGGISIKPAAGMEEMTMDMAGAAAVLHTVVAAAKLALPINVTAYLCLAENMPGGNAQRPGDVITIRGGKTVEVNNTDAEGRLVMADGLVSAVEDGHDTVIDIATLTGAQMVALGTRTAAIMGTDDVREALFEASKTVGEAAWPMPLPEELAATMKSNVADMKNTADRWGGMCYAGVFLQQFVGETPWGHLDIAGPAWTKSAHGYTTVAGTGYGVRTLLGYLEARAA